MKISIGIPTYNQGQFLEQSILSALNQTIAPYEIIVSNNFSDDSQTSLVLEKYKDLIQVISPPRHLGLIEHFDFLARQFKGDYCCFCCSDDFLEPRLLESFLSNYEDSPILYRFGINLVNEAGNILKTSGLNTVRKYSSFPANFYEQLSGMRGSIAAAIYKTSAIKKVDYFNDGLSLSGDWALHLKLSELGVFKKVKYIGANVRINYRPNLNIDRFNLELNDNCLIFGKIQLHIIQRNKLSYLSYKNSARIRLFRFEQFFKEYFLINEIPELTKFKEVVHPPHIMSKLNYWLLVKFQFVSEVIFKKW